jgi:hypothetical protein
MLFDLRLAHRGDILLGTCGGTLRHSFLYRLLSLMLTHIVGDGLRYELRFGWSLSWLIFQCRGYGLHRGAHCTLGLLG